ncbi:hypothetical protein ACELLULO517_18220 [Acidisoma cellulosilytica]|uniref:Uncharacterized protein n=1 Tax=Acidisoma cellulosilyticum TaxID=2802395 RepID=A0A963Z5G8_9PROT|nr:hypothetical protein [Acidisoma cellulosilyticum]MCB8882188.1 hypothetical protein [Acidisoma cellulosilyticum]
MTSPINGAYAEVLFKNRRKNTHIAWVDEVSLTREVLSSAVLNANSSFEITEFDSIDDCLLHREQVFDTIIYHSHQVEFTDFCDVETLSDAYPGASIILVSDASTLDKLVLNRTLESGASTYFLSRVTSIAVFVEALEFANARRNVTV